MDKITTTFVAAGHLVACTEPQQSPMLNNVADSLLFAQVTADTKTSRFESPAQWLFEHNKALRALKWVGNEFEAHTFELDEADTLTVESVVERVLLAALPAGPVEQVRQALKCVNDWPDQDAQQLFRHTVLAPCTESTGNPEDPEVKSAIALLLSAFEPNGTLSCLWVSLRTTATLAGSLLRQPVTGKQIKGAVEVQLLRREWSAKEYEKVRDKVEAYLSGSQRERILPLKCSTPPDVEQKEAGLPFDPTPA